MKKYLSLVLAVLFTASVANAGMWKHLYPTWTDTLTPALAARGGVTAPAFTAFRGGIYALNFVGAATDDEVHFAIQFPHSYKEQSDVDVHLHVTTGVTGTTGNGTCEFCLEYEWVPIGGTFSAITSSVCKTFNISTTSTYVHELWEIADINGVGFGTGVSSIFIGRLWRYATGPNDNYTSTIYLHSIDMHFQQDTSGSWQEYAK